MRKRWLRLGTALLLLTVLGSGLGFVAAPTSPEPANPFPQLEAAMRRRIAELSAAGAAAPGSARFAAGEEAYAVLHNIRNHRAFLELWEGWGWTGPEIRVLYVGAGSHLAPLVFLHGSRRLRRADFVFTEIDPAAARRIEILLSGLVALGAYRDLTIALEPLPDPALDARWRKALQSDAAGRLRSSPEAFLKYYESATAGLKAPPGFVADYRFFAGSTAARISLLVGARDAAPGGTAYFRYEDLSRADLFVTHDWDSAPRGNLQVLYDVLSSCRAGGAKRVPAVMMEDLGTHPDPVDLSFFGPVARSQQGYGHQEYARLGGVKLDAEDGAALYLGGVVLAPSQQFFGGLTPRRIEAFFDFLLFKDAPYERRNADVVAGNRVLAPLFLDLYSGFGSRNIRGEDVSAAPGFLARLTEDACGLLNEDWSGQEAARDRWCEALARFRRSLQARVGRDDQQFLTDAAKEVQSSPFLRSAPTRAKAEAALNDRKALAQLLLQHREACRLALERLSAVDDPTRGGCGQPRGRPTEQPG